MKELIFILLMATVIPLSVIAATTDPTQPDSTATSSGEPNRSTSARKCRQWKDSERFDISRIDGLYDEYNPGEPIVFFVEGKSDKLIVEKENGFYVSALLGNHSDHKVFGAKVDYDPDKHAWKVEFTAPESAKQYDISLYLLCRPDESPCAAVFGVDTWVNIIRQVTVR